MLLQLNLPQLQNLIKRDPASYRDDFSRQLRHYESLMELLLLNPAENAEMAREFCELTLFLAHVRCDCDFRFAMSFRYGIWHRRHFFLKIKPKFTMIFPQRSLLVTRTPAGASSPPS